MGRNVISRGISARGPILAFFVATFVAPTLGCAQTNNAAAAMPMSMPAGIWQARLGIEGESPQLFSELSAQGFHAVDVAGYRLSDGRERFATVWMFGDAGGGRLSTSLDAAALITLATNATKLGTHLTRISAWPTPDGTRFAAIEEPMVAPDLVLRVDVTAEGLTAELEAGMCAVDLAGYGTAEGTRYVALLTKDARAKSVHAHYGLDAKAVEALIVASGQKGARPLRIVGWEEDGAARFSALFIDIPGPYWMVRNDVTPEAYQRALEEAVATGYRVGQLSAFAIGGELHLTAVFTQ